MTFKIRQHAGIFDPFVPVLRDPLLQELRCQKAIYMTSEGVMKSRPIYQPLDLFFFSAPRMSLLPNIGTGDLFLHLKL